MKKKTVALLLALVLAVGVAAGGTMAWLLDETDSITNTFTAGNVEITLSETDPENDNNAASNSYKMVPGITISKNPTVTVTANSEACYVFVELEKSTNFDTFMTYAVADGWTAGDGTDIPANVYYRTVNASTANQAFKVLKDDQVTVQSTVTKEQMNGVASSGQPTLTVTAYACQLAKSSNESFAAGEAWEQVNGLNSQNN